MLNFLSNGNNSGEQLRPADVLRERAGEIEFARPYAMNVIYNILGEPVAVQPVKTSEAVKVSTPARQSEAPYQLADQVGTNVLQAVDQDQARLAELSRVARREAERNEPAT